QEPAAVEVSSFEASPVEPAPAEASPVEPAPAEAAPVEPPPTPSEPAPAPAVADVAEPAPAEAVSAETAPTEPSAEPPLESAPEEAPPEPIDFAEPEEDLSFSDGPTVVGGLAYEQAAILQSLGVDDEPTREPTEIPIDFGPEVSAVKRPLDLGAILERREASAPAPVDDEAEPSGDLPASIEPIEFAPEASRIEEDLDFSATLPPLTAEEPPAAPAPSSDPMDFAVEPEAPVDLVASAGQVLDPNLGGWEPDALGDAEPPGLALDDLPSIDLRAP